MKKVILFVAMLLATNVTAIAGDINNSKENVVETYDINININSLAKYLELSEAQKEEVYEIQKYFSEGLRCAGSIEDSNRRKNMVKSAIDYDLRNLSYVLNEKQFKKYLKVLNITMYNRGIEL